MGRVALYVPEMSTAEGMIKLMRDSSSELPLVIIVAATS